MFFFFRGIGKEVFLIYRIRRSCILLALVFFCSLMFAHPHHVYAVGEGNIDSGGGGMGQGSSENVWSPGNDGVRVTVIRASDRSPVTRPIDITNKQPDIVYSFGKVSKVSYTGGRTLTQGCMNM